MGLERVRETLTSLQHFVYYSVSNVLGEVTGVSEQGVSRLVKQLRERLGLTQERFAQEVGVTFSTVNQWENGHRRPQPYLLKRPFEMERRLNQENAK